MYIFIDCDILDLSKDTDAEIRRMGLSATMAYFLLTCYARVCGTTDGKFHYGDYQKLMLIMKIDSYRRMHSLLKKIEAEKWIEVDHENCEILIVNYLKRQAELPPSELTELQIQLINMRKPVKRSAQASLRNDQPPFYIQENKNKIKNSSGADAPSLKDDFFDRIIAEFKTLFNDEEFGKVRQFAAACWKKGGVSREPVIFQIIHETKQEKGKWVNAAAYSKWANPSVPEQERQSNAIKQARQIDASEFTGEMKGAIDQFGRVS